MYPACRGALFSAPGLHGYQRAVGLISGKTLKAKWVTRLTMRREDRSSISLSFSRGPRRESLSGSYLHDTALLTFPLFDLATFPRPDLRASNGVPVERWSRLAVALFSSLLPHFPGDALTRRAGRQAQAGWGDASLSVLTCGIRRKADSESEGSRTVTRRSRTVG